ncbi:hypothetical protein BH20ACI2_BH20ACI2_22990 [soil metagenome]
MRGSLSFLTLFICSFSIASVSAQESSVGVAPLLAPTDLLSTVEFEVDTLSRGPLNVKFVPANMSRSHPVTVLESHVDFSMKRAAPERSLRVWKFDPDNDVKFVDVPNSRDAEDAVLKDRPTGDGFQWGPAIRQSLLFLAVQHGYAMTQPKTRDALRGPFFKDYIRSVGSLSGWNDGGRFFTNYVAHPMQGSFTGFIQIQNDPRGMSQTFGRSGKYWKSRMKALAWSAAWSTQFEIGPISQASIGNVGHNGKQTYIDIVVTPTVGLGMLITEDILDKYVVRKIEMLSGNFLLRVLSRMMLNPTRTVANVTRFKLPWHRDHGLRL